MLNATSLHLLRKSVTASPHISRSTVVEEISYPQYGNLTVMSLLFKMFVPKQFVFMPFCSDLLRNFEERRPNEAPIDVPMIPKQISTRCVVEGNTPLFVTQ